MIASSLIQSLFGAASSAAKFFQFLGSAEISMLLATGAAIWLLGCRRGMNAVQVNHCVTDSVARIANVLFVISAGGILKQVIIDSGVGDHIVTMMSHVPLSPFIIAADYRYYSYSYRPGRRCGNYFSRDCFADGYRISS